MARRLLNAAGFRVVGEAVDGRGAIAASLSLVPEIILLSVDLPDDDGLAVAKEITSWDDSPAVYLVAGQETGMLGPLAEQCGVRGLIPRARFSPSGLATIINRATA